jgi:hypothetical protein
MSPNAGMVGLGVSADEYSCILGAQINFGDLTLYLTYGTIAIALFYAARVQILHGRS